MQREQETVDILQEIQKASKDVQSRHELFFDLLCEKYIHTLNTYVIEIVKEMEMQIKDKNMSYEQQSQQFKKSVFQKFSQFDIRLKNVEKNITLMKRSIEYYTQQAMKSQQWKKKCLKNIEILEKAVYQAHERLYVIVSGKTQSLPIVVAMQKNDEKMMAMFFHKGIYINQKNKDGQTALMMAVEKNNRKYIGFLLRAGADVNIQDNHGQTALMIAIGKGYEQIVEYLLEAGTDVDIQDNHGETALMMAIQKNNKNILQLVFHKNPDIHKEDIHGNTALDIAIFKRPNAALAILVQKNGIRYDTTSGGPPCLYIKRKKQDITCPEQKQQNRFKLGQGGFGIVYGPFPVVQYYDYEDDQDDDEGGDEGGNEGGNESDESYKKHDKQIFFSAFVDNVLKLETDVTHLCNTIFESAQIDNVVIKCFKKSHSLSDLKYIDKWRVIHKQFSYGTKEHEFFILPHVVIYNDTSDQDVICAMQRYGGRYTLKHIIQNTSEQRSTKFWSRLCHNLNTLYKACVDVCTKQSVLFTDIKAVNIVVKDDDDDDDGDDDDKCQISLIDFGMIKLQEKGYQYAQTTCDRRFVPQEFLLLLKHLQKTDDRLLSQKQRRFQQSKKQDKTKKYTLNEPYQLLSCEKHSVQHIAQFILYYTFLLILTRIVDKIFPPQIYQKFVDTYVQDMLRHRHFQSELPSFNTIQHLP